MLLNQWITKEIKERIKTYLETNDKTRQSKTYAKQQKQF